MSDSQRDQLRKTLRRARSQLDAGVAQQHSAAICAQAATLITHSEHIAGYYAFGKEVDLSPLMKSIGGEHKIYYVPVVLPEFKMRFAPVNEYTPVTLNQYGIKEPQVDSQDYKDAHHLDAVLVPLVGFDEQCNRMGMGGGYYDRCFAHRTHATGSPLLIGVAYELQYADTVYAESWDVPLDYVVTESRVISR